MLLKNDERFFWVRRVKWVRKVRWGADEKNGVAVMGKTMIKQFNVIRKKCLCSLYMDVLENKCQ